MIHVNYKDKSNFQNKKLTEENLKDYNRIHIGQQKRGTYNIENTTETQDYIKQKISSGYTFQKGWMKLKKKQHFKITVSMERGNVCKKPRGKGKDQSTD